MLLWNQCFRKKQVVLSLKQPLQDKPKCLNIVTRKTGSRNKRCCLKKKCCGYTNAKKNLTDRNCRLRFTLCVAMMTVMDAQRIMISFSSDSSSLEYSTRPFRNARRN